MDFVSPAEKLVKQHGFDHFGWVQLERPLTLDIYRQWLESGLHADMEYLSDHLPLKEDPKRLAPRAKSALVVTLPYVPHPFPNSEPGPGGGLRSALYARGEDYHLHFRSRLQSLAADLGQLFPAEEFLCFTDSAPILERDLAYRAGLGWFGKNTCLIDRGKGSLFFLGQILTSLTVNQSAPLSADFCGTCDRCIKACPTGALTPRQLDANLCISYWTIEARDNAPEELRARFEDWFFGCDICQTVCPWNEKAFAERLRLEPAPKANLIDDLRFILRSSHKLLERTFRFSPLSRARPLGLKRNALVVIGNKRLKELREDVLPLSQNSRLKDLADWTLRQLI